MSTKDFKPIIEGETPVPADAKVVRWVPDDGCNIEWTNENGEKVEALFAFGGVWAVPPQEVREELQQVLNRPPVALYRAKN